MFYDDLPIWGFIGKLEKVSKPSGIEIRYFIFTHVHFEILWNLQHIVEINVSTDPNQVVDISEDVVGSSPDATVNTEFTYSAKWKESEITFDKRMDKYRRNQFLPQHLEVAQLHLPLLQCSFQSAVLPWWTPIDSSCQEFSAHLLTHMGSNSHACYALSCLTCITFILRFNWPCSSGLYIHLCCCTCCFL